MNAIIVKALSERKAENIKVSQFHVPSSLKEAFRNKAKNESISMSKLVNVAIEVCEMSSAEAKKKLVDIKKLKEERERLPLRITPQNKRVLSSNASALNVSMTQLIILLISKCILTEK